MSEWSSEIMCCVKIRIIVQNWFHSICVVCSWKDYKGQLISKGLFDVIVATKIPTKDLRISALKRGHIKKIKALILHSAEC